ncbi:zinc finger protein 239-like isoform X2 [Coccinella septempunctata]|uniref:zinc finger protein 239-like isoform X2 n=1 Tax=Coccinella septempunctata TaxID=41139 RepID=UPI001D0758A8|nr:zinc finger protein 239-like isoform X2 [Coccinella septempunctata]
MEVTSELLPCPLCSLPHFKDVHSLRSTLISAATTKLICPVCYESVLGLDKLTIHLFSHMSSRPSTEENRESHYKVGETEYLNKVNENSPMIEKINSIPKNVESDTVICEICDFTFNDQTILELHKKLIHPINPDKGSGIYNFHCHLCTKKFKMRGSLMVHLRVVHYGFSGSAVGKNTIKLFCNANKEALPKQWECDICYKMFTTKYFLKKHKRLHTGEMPYTCLQCNKSFTFQQSYHKHMLYHSSEKPHTCMECGRCFKELSTLQNHARIHSGERPFVCETCGKSFRQRVSYLVHQRIHTGAMPYDCERCGKKFRYKNIELKHQPALHMIYTP